MFPAPLVVRAVFNKATTSRSRLGMVRYLSGNHSPVTYREIIGNSVPMALDADPDLQRIRFEDPRQYARTCVQSVALNPNLDSIARPEITHSRTKPDC